MARLKGLFLIMLLLFLPACSQVDSSTGVDSTRQTELLVSAAASLQEALTAVQEDYRQQNPHVKIIFNFGSSGTLQRQIEQGAPADLFISAGEKQMDELVEKGLILPGSREDLLSNRLALITGLNSQEIAGITDLENETVSRIALPIPDTSPAGQYTKEALVNLRLWDRLQSKLVMAKDVKQVLAYVETGNAEAGFLYHSDALTSEKIRIEELLSPELHEPIVYPAAVVNETKNQAIAREFLAFLGSEQARGIFEAHGFTLLKGRN